MRISIDEFENLTNVRKAELIAYNNIRLNEESKDLAFVAGAKIV